MKTSNLVLKVARAVADSSNSEGCDPDLTVVDRIWTDLLSKLSQDPKSANEVVFYQCPHCDGFSWGYDGEEPVCVRSGCPVTEGEAENEMLEIPVEAVFGK